MNDRFPFRIGPLLIIAFLAIPFLAFGLIKLQMQRLDAVERFYLRDYLVASIRAPIPPLPLSRHKPDLHMLLFRNCRSNAVAAVPGAALTDLCLRPFATSPAAFASWLRTYIFGVSAFDLLKPSLYLAGALGFILLLAAGSWDAKYRRSLVEGRQVRGRQLLTVAQFNRRGWWKFWRKKDGFRLVVK